MEAMRRLILFLAVGMLLTACDTQSERDQAAAARLSAQAAQIQAQAQATRVQALIDSQNGRVSDYQAVLILAVVLAAGSMAVSIGVLLVLHRIARTPAQIVYQAYSPVGIQAPAQFPQINERYEWPEERAKRRALAQIGNEGKL